MFNEKVKLGNEIQTATGNRYVFVHDPYEENTPYYQIDLLDYNIVDAFPTQIFIEEVKLGYELAVGGEITAIFN